MHTNEANNHQYDAIALLFIRQQQCLSSIKVLCQLIKVIQNHRGASMDFLNGDNSCMPLCHNLKTTIEKLLYILHLKNQQPDSVINSATLICIENDWKTIKTGWENDLVLSNFEFHCHLIDTIKKSIRATIKENLLNESNKLSDFYYTFLELLFIHIPDTIESLENLKDLIAIPADIYSCRKENHIRLSFLLREIHHKNDCIIQSIRHINQQGKKIPSLYPIKEQQKKLLKFLLSIKIIIIDNEKTKTNLGDLFNLSNSLISIYWLTIDNSLQATEKYIYDYLINHNKTSF